MYNIISYCVRLYYHFILNYRNVESIIIKNLTPVARIDNNQRPLFNKYYGC